MTVFQVATGASRPQNSKVFTQRNKHITKLKIYFRDQEIIFLPWSTEIQAKNYKNKKVRPVSSTTVEGQLKSKPVKREIFLKVKELLLIDK